MQFATAQFDYDLSSLQNTNEELLHLHKLQMWFLKVFSTHTHAQQQLLKVPVLPHAHTTTI
jgi:hypothetical protein